MSLPASYLKKCAASDQFKINPPTLDELYNLCSDLPKFKSTTDLTLLSKMRIAISNMCCSSYLNEQSMYDFWLMFYMKEVYGLEWYENNNSWK